MSDRAAHGWLPVAAGLAVLWVAVRGPAPTPTRVAEEIVVGVAVGLPLAYAGRRFYRPVDGTDLGALSVPYAVLYLATFLVELVTANVDVARRAVSPSLPISPAVLEIPLRVESDLAVVTLANSITLTPGTLVMDHDRGRNVLYVHSIDGSDPSETVATVRRWEDYLLVVFDERLKPGDPPPTPGDAGSTADRRPDPSDAPAADGPEGRAGGSAAAPRDDAPPGADDTGGGDGG